MNDFCQSFLARQDFKGPNYLFITRYLLWEDNIPTMKFVDNFLGSKETQTQAVKDSTKQSTLSSEPLHQQKDCKKNHKKVLLLLCKAFGLPAIDHREILYPVLQLTWKQI